MCCKSGKPFEELLQENGLRRWGWPRHLPGEEVMPWVTYNGARWRAAPTDLNCADGMRLPATFKQL